MVVVEKSIRQLLSFSKINANLFNWLFPKSKDEKAVNRPERSNRTECTT